MVERDYTFPSFAIKDIMKAAMSARERHVDRNSTPDSGDCRNVVKAMIKYGIDQLVFMVGIPRDENSFASVTHCCAMLVWSGPTVLVDPQYLQFVSPEKRDGLPEVMIVSAYNEKVLIEGLRRHCINDDNHSLWTDLLFKK